MQLRVYRSNEYAGLNLFALHEKVRKFSGNQKKMPVDDDDDNCPFRRITDKLLLQRSEHNDGDLTSLEEISLHQQHLMKIEYINRYFTDKTSLLLLQFFNKSNFRVCPNLKVLHLQDNSIGKLENLSRLKRLENLNLAMNCVERVENLASCESLQKLDLTLNFVGDLTGAVRELRGLEHLADLFFTGNPCAQYVS